MEKNRVIANPPIGVYTNSKTHLGHAFFLVLLDVYARYRASLGCKVVFPSKSYNFFGKRGDDIALMEGLDPIELRNKELKEISLDVTREKLNLSSAEILIDDDEQIIRGVKEDINKLLKKGYAFLSGEELFLDCPQITKRFDLERILADIAFRPPRLCGEIKRLIRHNTSYPIRLSRNTRYSALFDENTRLGPLVVLADLWDHKYPNSNFTIAGSNSVLAKYIFLRYLLRVSLDNSPGMDEVITWPKIVCEGGMESWDLNEMIKDPYHGDMVRHLLVSSYSEKQQKVNIEKNKFLRSRNFIYLMLNLRKVLKGTFQAKPFDEEYYKAMNLFRLDYVLNIAEERIKHVSRAINIKRDFNEWSESERFVLASEYASQVHKLLPFFPATTSRIMEDMVGG